jgi:hypothetical protein
MKKSVFKVVAVAVSLIALSASLSFAQNSKGTNEISFETSLYQLKDDISQKIKTLLAKQEEKYKAIESIAVPIHLENVKLPKSVWLRVQNELKKDYLAGGQKLTLDNLKFEYRLSDKIAETSFEFENYWFTLSNGMGLRVSRNKESYKITLLNKVPHSLNEKKIVLLSHQHLWDIPYEAWVSARRELFKENLNIYDVVSYIGNDYEVNDNNPPKTRIKLDYILAIRGTGRTLRISRLNNGEYSSLVYDTPYGIP